MPHKTYLWIEDRTGKSGHTFWKTMMQQLFPEVIVESKKNNSELVKAVQNLSDRENQYIVVFDSAFDNIQVIREHQLLQKSIQMKSNVHELRIICFEYILLEFKKLLEWIYAPGDELIPKRIMAITAREKLITALQNPKTDYKQLTEIKEYNSRVDTLNIEQFAAKLLFDLTRNTGFEVSKGSLGQCWIVSCCEWHERQADDICGLDENRISLIQKMKVIFQNTSLQSEFQKAGLEVAL